MSTQEIRILAVGTMLPGPPIDNVALTRRLRLPPQAPDWINAFLGTRTRHFAVDLESGEVRDTMADMGEEAARRALAAAGIGPDAVDVVVMGTSTPDMLIPTTATQIADRLGIDGIPVYQMQSGCTGAMQALNVAFHLLRSGAYRTALVLGSEMTAKFLDLDAPPASLSSGEQVSNLMFGDAAGAAVLSADPDARGPVLRATLHRLDGLGRAPGHSMHYFGVVERDPDLGQVMFEDYKAIEQLVPPMSVQTLEELLAQVEWKAEQVDYLLPPQLSGVMTGRIVRQMGLPEATEISCVAQTGNTGNALPFLQLEQLWPLLKPGRRAVAVSIESSKWIRAAFALETGDDAR